MRNNVLLKAIDEQMRKLSTEGESLVKKRSELEEEIQNINVRITQIVGALQELDNLKRIATDDKQEKDTEK